MVTTNFAANSIAILRGNGNGTFQAPVFYPVGASPEQLAVTDFNGDGIPDIVTANEGDNTISVLIGNGDGTLRTGNQLCGWCAARSHRGGGPHR